MFWFLCYNLFSSSINLIDYVEILNSDVTCVIIYYLLHSYIKNLHTYGKICLIQIRYYFM